MLASTQHQFPGALNATVDRRLLDCRQDFLRFFRRRLGRPEDAEDALQDFYLKAIGAAGKLQDNQKIDAWLGRILRNTLIDHYRRRAARQRAEAAYGLEIQETVVEIDADEDAKPCGCIHLVLPTLRPDYAEILRRVDLNEEPRERIADDLALTLNNVGVRLHRARRALKEKLEGLCPTCRDGGFLSCDCEPADRTRSLPGGPPIGLAAAAGRSAREGFSPSPRHL